MRTAVYYNNSDTRLEWREKPKPGRGEVLLKVRASGICGSDVMEWYRIKKAPLVLGHEIAGEIEEVGDGVKGFSVGDRVFATHHVPCGECPYCLDGRETSCDTLRSTKFHPGGFSEYVRVPAINVDKGTFKLPDTLSYDDGTFIEPLGCAVRAQRIAGMKKGYSVLVLGSGISGILHIKLAKAYGASKVFATDISGYRLGHAKRCGAVPVNANENVPEEIKKQNSGKLADLAIVCTGASSAVLQAAESVDRGGTIMLFAPTAPDEETPIDLNKLWCNLTTLTTSYAADRDDLEEAISLLKTKKVTVSDMVTHHLPLEKTGEGFRLVSEAGDSLKVIIEPQK